MQSSLELSNGHHWRASNAWKTLLLLTVSFVAGGCVGLSLRSLFVAETRGLTHTRHPQDLVQTLMEEDASASSIADCSPPLVHNSTPDVVHMNGFAADSTNTTTQKWCPNAICKNSDLCRPCQRRFLILLATGRSASTTLTYMLDSLPGVRMSGENNDELQAIRKMIDNVRRNANFQRHAGRRTPWGHNRVPDGAYSCVGQHMIETINPPATDEMGRMLENNSETIVGFKTIRFLSDKPEEQTPELVEWLQETFPCARIVINIRSSVEEQAASWKKSFGKKGNFSDELADMNRRMRNLADIFGEQAFLLDSSDWLNEIEHLNRVVEWLGFDKSCFFEELLEFNTKGRGYGNGVTSTHRNPDCRYAG